MYSRLGPALNASFVVRVHKVWPIDYPSLFLPVPAEARLNLNHDDDDVYMSWKQKLPAATTGK